MIVETVSERKARETARRAAAAVMDEMRSFMREHGGRFLVFGSAAAGAMQHDSEHDWRFASERLRARATASAVVIDEHASYNKVDSPDM